MCTTVDKLWTESNLSKKLSPQFFPTKTFYLSIKMNLDPERVMQISSKENILDLNKIF